MNDCDDLRHYTPRPGYPPPATSLDAKLIAYLEARQQESIQRVAEQWQALSERERRLVVRVNSDVTMSRGKYAAQAIHAALLLLDAHPGCPVIVLGERRSKIGRCEVVVHDAGWTELAPGTLTAGASWE